MVQKKIQKAYLMPLMPVAGDHAKNDMAGEEKDFWEPIFSNDGISCVTVLKGTAEYDGCVCRHLDRSSKRPEQ